MSLRKVMSNGWVLGLGAILVVAVALGIPMADRAGAHDDDSASGASGVHVCIDHEAPGLGEMFFLEAGDCDLDKQTERHWIGWQIIGGGDARLPGSSDDKFIPLRYSASETEFHDVSQIMPMGGVVSNFSVVVDAAPGAGVGWDFTVYKADSRGAAGSATSVTCKIDGSLASCSSASSVTFAAGNLIAINVAPVAGGPSSVRVARWTAAYGPVTLP